MGQRRLPSYVFRRLRRPQVILSAVLAISSTLLHFRGRVRLAPLRQAGDHSTFTAPYNLLVYAASLAPGTPFLDLQVFPELQTVIHRWREIRDEASALQQAGGIRHATGANDMGFHTFFKRGWTRFYLFWYGQPPASALAACPRTCAILAAAPSIKGAMFAVLPSGAQLGRHRDPFAGSLRFHLGLDTPNDQSCWIEVDGRRAWWRDGEGLLFDETYVHEARNEADRDRLILLCDVERPLRPAMRELNRLVMRVVMSATATQNIEGEPIGALNRLFGRVHGLLELGKKYKAKDRKRYYAVKKTVVVAALVGLIASILA
jgi:beta-hydroxylase